MSRRQMNRDELVAALNRALRDASGQGVLYSQAVAERLGVGSTDLECLDIIVMRGPLSAGELASASGLTTDQRGRNYDRVFNGIVDIGAVEVQPPFITIQGQAAQGDPVGCGRNRTGLAPL